MRRNRLKKSIAHDVVEHIDINVSRLWYVLNDIRLVLVLNVAFMLILLVTVMICAIKYCGGY